MCLMQVLDANLRLVSMVNAFIGKRRTLITKVFWRCVALLMIFAQSAVAADLCIDAAKAWPSTMAASAEALGGHRLADEVLCAGEIVPAAQAPTADPVTDLPDVAPVAAAIVTRPPRQMLVTRQAPDGASTPGVAIFLQLNRLQL